MSLYCRRYAELAEENAGDTSGKMRRLGREIRDLQKGKNELPLQPAASIFLRHDADRMDKLRACIMGACVTLRLPCLCRCTCACVCACTCLLFIKSCR